MPTPATPRQPDPNLDSPDRCSLIMKLEALETQVSCVFAKQVSMEVKLLAACSQERLKREVMQVMETQLSTEEKVMHALASQLLRLDALLALWRSSVAQVGIGKISSIATDSLVPNEYKTVHSTSDTDVQADACSPLSKGESLKRPERKSTAQPMIPNTTCTSTHIIVPIENETVDIARDINVQNEACRPLSEGQSNLKIAMMPKSGREAAESWKRAMRPGTVMESSEEEQGERSSRRVRVSAKDVKHQKLDALMNLKSDPASELEYDEVQEVQDYFSMPEIDCSNLTYTGKSVELRKLLLYAENIESELAKADAEVPFAQRVMFVMDTSIGCIIAFNALYLGFAADASGSFVVEAIGLLFVLVFIAEMLLKWHIFGLCGRHGYFCGPLRVSHIFDFGLVIIDVLSLTMQFVKGSNDNNTAGLFRLVRLMKLARLVRLLRSEIFKDLLMMVQGMLGGLSTLLWAVGFFLVILYAVALVFREIYGNPGHQEPNEVLDSFSTMPHSLFTTFRCGFGDCTSKNGVPIFEFVFAEHGLFSVHVLVYIAFVFSFTIGAHNVISAIFVESTLSAASATMSAQKEERLCDKGRWACNIARLVDALLEVNRNNNTGAMKRAKGLSDNYIAICQLDLPRSVIDDLVKAPAAIEALKNLEIDPADFNYLSDILDPDNGGTITVLDLVDGLRRLRGDPRRSDIVSVDLTIRSIQANVNTILDVVTGVYDPEDHPQYELGCLRQEDTDTMGRIRSDFY